MEKKKLVEAALFISGKEVKKAELAEMLQMEPEAVEHYVGALEKEYSGRDSCITIRRAGEVYKMDIIPEYVEAVRRLAPEVELGRGLLKALSFVAYKQPARQSDLVKILGNRTYDYVHELLERGFITSERWGRSRKLETTDKFAAYFGSKEILSQRMEELRRSPPEKARESKEEAYDNIEESQESQEETWESQKGAQESQEESQESQEGAHEGTAAEGPAEAAENILEEFDDTAGEDEGNIKP